MKSLTVVILISSYIHTTSIFTLPLNHVFVSSRSWWQLDRQSKRPSLRRFLVKYSLHALLLWFQYIIACLLFDCHFIRALIRSYCDTYFGNHLSLCLLSHIRCWAYAIIYFPFWGFHGMYATIIRFLVVVFHFKGYKTTFLTQRDKHWGPMKKCQFFWKLPHSSLHDSGLQTSCWNWILRIIWRHFRILVASPAGNPPVPLTSCFPLPPLQQRWLPYAWLDSSF